MCYLFCCSRIVNSYKWVSRFLHSKWCDIELLLSISKAHLLESRVCFKKCFHLVLATAENKEEGKRPKPAAKSLPELMWEDVIPPLKTILESQHHLSQIQLYFQDNKVLSLYFLLNLLIIDGVYESCSHSELDSWKVHFWRMGGLIHSGLSSLMKNLQVWTIYDKLSRSSEIEWWHRGAFPGWWEENHSEACSFLGWKAFGSSRNHPCLERMIIIIYSIGKQQHTPCLV